MWHLFTTWMKSFCFGELYFYSSCMVTFLFPAARQSVFGLRALGLQVFPHRFLLSAVCRQLPAAGEPLIRAVWREPAWYVAIKALLTFLLPMQSAGSASERTVCSSAASVIKCWRSEVNLMAVLLRVLIILNEMIGHISGCWQDIIYLPDFRPISASDALLASISSEDNDLFL